MEILLVLFLVVAVAAATIGVAASRRRARRPELEPPARRPPEPLRPGVPRPDRPPAPAEAGEQASVAPELQPGQVAEAEAAAESQAEVEAAAPAAPALEAVPEAAAAPEPVEVAPAPERPRFRDRLTKARGALAGALGGMRGRDRIDDETWDDLEDALVTADVGVGTATALLDGLREKVRSDGISTPDALLDALKADLKQRLSGRDRELRMAETPTVWLFVGVNGVGKTTTIGKVGLWQATEGRSVVMAAADTFRAAAGEQLELWSKRVGADLVRGREGSDPGAVVFDAVEKAAARGADLVLADTAGRLHTKVNLMEELKKVRRVAEREPGHLTEVLLVIDANTGQNGLVQAREFTEAVGVTGVVLAKLDSSAKGGIAVAIETELGIPVKLAGLGETAEDLVPFDPDEYVEALFE